MSILKSIFKSVAKEAISRELERSASSSETGSTQYAGSSATTSGPANERRGNKCYGSCVIDEVNRRDYVEGERNLFDYRGEPLDYFREVLRDNFTGYDIRENVKINPKSPNPSEFVFYTGDHVDLVVEILWAGSARESTKYYCKEKRIPYLRFYYGHEGWWNTEKYVVDRIRGLI